MLRLLQLHWKAQITTLKQSTTISMKKMYEVVLIDNNGCATSEVYDCSDMTVLFAILAKELMNKNIEYGIRKIIIEELK